MSAVCSWEADHKISLLVVKANILKAFADSFVQICLCLIIGSVKQHIKTMSYFLILKIIYSERSQQFGPVLYTPRLSTSWDISTSWIWLHRHQAVHYRISLEFFWRFYECHLSFFLWFFTLICKLITLQCQKCPLTHFSKWILFTSMNAGVCNHAPWHAEYIHRHFWKTAVKSEDCELGLLVQRQRLYPHKWASGKRTANHFSKCTPKSVESFPTWALKAVKGEPTYKNLIDYKCIFM